MSAKPLASLALALLLGLGATAAAAMTVSLTPPSTLIRVGDIFDLRVSVSGAQDGSYAGDEVIAFGLDVAIGNTALAVWTGAAVANPPFPDDTSALFLNTDVAGSVGAGTGVTGSGFDLATLHFLALAEGTFDLGVLSDLTDSNEGIIYLGGDPRDLDASLRLTIAPAAEAPLPGSLVLLLTALPWLRRLERGQPGRAAS